MTILYYTWDENSKNDMEQTLRKLGHEIVFFDQKFQSYENDDVFSGKLEKTICENKCDCIFSFDFFPLLAKTAEKLKIKYISWIYDSPHYTVFSPSARSEWNYIFVFDRAQYQILSARGIPHLFHFPLAVNTTRLNGQLGNLQNETDYRDDVSFVGSLYQNNMYDQIKYLPDGLRGYIDGLMAAQSKVYGYNLIGELITDEIAEQMNQYVGLNFEPAYQIRDRVLYSDMVNAKLTSKERTELLGLVAKRQALTIYTASDSSLVAHAKKGGIVSYDKGMPEVFRRSKMNLNITLRSIESGIPLRALDIMGAGGFLLSNYQAELADNFVDGEELVLFDSAEDLLCKVDYYLSHEEERKEITYRGWKKVCEKYSYEKRVEEMLRLIS